MDDLLTHPYKTNTVAVIYYLYGLDKVTISYWRLIHWSVWHRYIVISRLTNLSVYEIIAMYLWCMDELTSHPHQITTVLMGFRDGTSIPHIVDVHGHWYERKLSLTDTSPELPSNLKIIRNISFSWPNNVHRIIHERRSWWLHYCPWLHRGLSLAAFDASGGNSIVAKTTLLSQSPLWRHDLSGDVMTYRSCARPSVVLCLDRTHNKCDEKAHWDHRIVNEFLQKEEDKYSIESGNLWLGAPRTAYYNYGDLIFVFANYSHFCPYQRAGYNVYLWFQSFTHILHIFLIMVVLGAMLCSIASRFIECPLKHCATHTI